jgi:SAM-dependent methyltransferase
MNEEFFNLDFWRERIKQAGDNLWLSVYKCDSRTWQDLCIEHEKIIKKLCKGKILDCGCSYGKMTDWLTPEMDYTGIDFVPEFNELARKLHPNNKFVLGDLREKQEQFSDNEFDWGICISMISPAVEPEIKRICKQVLILKYSEPCFFSII